MLAATALALSLALPNPMPAIHHSPCPGAESANGCYIAAEHSIYIGNRAFTYWHELGHAFDHTRLSEGERNRFRYLTGDRARPWYERLPEGTHGLGGPADRLSRLSASEEFADAYANCQLHHHPYRGWETSTSYNPTPRTHRRVCRFIVRAAKTPGSAAPAAAAAAPPPRSSTRT